VAAGAGSLFLASYLGEEGRYVYTAWKHTYYAAAAAMGVGVATTLVIPEPRSNRDPSIYSYSSREYLRLFLVFLAGCAAFSLSFFLSGGWADQIKALLTGITRETIFSGFLAEAGRLFSALFVAACSVGALVRIGAVDRRIVVETYIEPVSEFFNRYGLKTAFLILALIGFYRVSDIVLGVISNVFYVDLGFSKNVIAGITKLYGVGMTIVGGFLGGMLTLRYGVYSILFLGALLSAATNLLFMVLATAGADVSMLTVVIAVDNLSAGLAATAFVAYLSSLTNISFTAVQYALFSSLMTLFPKLFGGYSGTLVDTFGYNSFFLLTALLGAPVLILIWVIHKKLGAAETAFRK